MKSGLWTVEDEIRFFISYLCGRNPDREKVSISKLMYNVNGTYMAYYPKNYRGGRSTLQSRNSYIGRYTEKWFSWKLGFLPSVEEGKYTPFLEFSNYFAIDSKSPADVALLSSKNELLAIFELKMSIVNNYKYNSCGRIKYIGDMSTHSGNPGLHRSDSTLKAIAKAAAIHIREFSENKRSVPIIIVTNAPPAPVSAERLKYAFLGGIIQGVWNVGFDKGDEGFAGYVHVNSLTRLNELVEDLIQREGHYFSGYMSLRELGELLCKVTMKGEDCDNIENLADKLIKLIRKTWGEDV